MDTQSLNHEIYNLIKEEIEPILMSHGGNINIKSIDNGVVTITLTGNCSHCPSAQITTEEVVKEKIMAKFSKDIKDVRLCNDISDEMWAYAKTFLSHES